MDFNFISPTMIVKRGGAATLGNLCAKQMKKACIFRYGEHFFTSGTYDKIKKSLDENNVESAVFYHVTGEPSPQLINDAAAFMRENGCDGGIAIGGGSVIDAAKAACALAPNGEDIMAYLEGFSPQPFANQPLPVVAVPTTAGTGSECTKNSVITRKGAFKNSVRDDGMLPIYALIDAELMLDVPKEVTATAGADCICQLIETYTSKFSNPLSDAIALGFIRTAFEALVLAYQDGQNVEAREKMGVSACACGMAMTNAGLGAAHGLAAGLGALTSLSHGLICGVVLPHVMRFNIGKGVLKYADIAYSMTGNAYSSPEEGAWEAVGQVEQLNRALGIPPNFKQFNIAQSEVPAIAKASMGSSMSKNAVEVTLEECEQLLYKLI